MSHFFLPALKQRMEKDVNEVMKIARNIKTKLEEIDEYVCSQLRQLFNGSFRSTYICSQFVEFIKQTEAWMWKGNSCRQIKNGYDCVRVTFCSQYEFIQISHIRT